MLNPVVLILADGMPAGGTERQIVELLKGLQKKEDLTTAFGVLVKGGEREKEANTYADITIPIRQSSGYDLTLAISLIGYVKRYGINIVHTFGSVSDFSGAVAGKFTSARVINGSIRSARPKLNKRDRLSKLCMPFADWIVANSKAGLVTFGLEHYPNASIINNGFDQTRFVNVQKVIYEKPTICMVGNFSVKKDQESLIKALPQIRQKIPNAELVLVGRGRNLQKCKELVSRLDLDEAVHFFADTNHPEGIIAGCRVGVLLSPQGEGFSNAIIEYMALGKPVVATDIGGNPELVDDSETGRLLSDHKSETIANAITDLLANKDKAKAMGEQGRQRVNQNYTLTRMVDAYENLYRQILDTNYR